jgi:hypothetical protein
LALRKKIVMARHLYRLSLTLVVGIFVAESALDCHLTGGGAPARFEEGILSSLDHLVVGLNHIAALAYSCGR